MARAIDSSYLLQHKRKVKFFGLGPDDESWGYAVPVEVIEKAPHPHPAERAGMRWPAREIYRLHLLIHS